MSHIAIVPSLLTGRLNASFEFSSRLIAEGHTITYLCPESSRDKVNTNGFEVVLIPDISFSYNNPFRNQMDNSWFNKLKFHFKNFNKHYDQGEKILNLEGHRSTIKELNPDLILIDNEIHELIFIAHELSIPVKLLTTWFSDKISLDNPSIRTNIIPGVGFAGSKIGILFSWIKIRLKINGRIIFNRIKFEHYRRWMIKTYAKKIGFNTKDLLPNTLPPLYSFKKLPILSFSMCELDFPQKRANNFFCIGPMIYEKRKTDMETVVSSKKIEVIFEDKLRSNKKIIYCSVGSMAKGSLVFLKKVISVVAQNDNWILILSIGPKMNIEDFTNVPSNVHIFNWVAQLDVLKKVNCCITHCGLNSVNECILNSVPMLLYSGKYTDENGNSARLAYHGLGIRGDIYEDSIETIAFKLRQILSNEKYQLNVNKFNKLCLAYRSKPLSPIVLG